jgi:hypothetical protein
VNEHDTPLDGDITAPSLVSFSLNQQYFSEGDIIEWSFSASDASDIYYADIEYLLPWGDYEVLEFDNDDLDGEFFISEEIDGEFLIGFYEAKSVYIVDNSSNRNSIEYRYDGSIYINGILQDSVHNFDLASLNINIVERHGSPGFEIVELSRSGSAVTYGLMVNPDVDPGEPGLGSFDFVLDYDPASLLFDADTIVFADGVTGLSGDHDTETGMVQFGGFVSDPAAPFSDFSKPLMQFEATITSRDTPVELIVADVLFDDVSVDGATASFDYSANSVTTVVTTRSGVVMEGVDVETVVLSQSGGMFLRATSVGNGVVQFELVAVPGASIGAVDFTISEASIAEFSLGPDLAGWTAEVNTDEPGVISVSAIGAVNGSLDLPSGEEVVLAKFTANGAIDLHVTDGMLGDVAQADVRVTSEAFATDVQGEMTSTFESGAQILVHADADFSNVAPTRAVTAQDALEALRLSVGMATTGGQSDAFAFIAADFNQSGKVNAHDALEILRYAVRAEGALDADWVFVDTNGDYSSIKRSSVEFEEGVAIASLTDDAEVYLTGILRGDVNDSISNMLL